MIGLEVILILVVTRIVLPIGLLILVGEWIRQREGKYWSPS